MNGTIFLSVQITLHIEADIENYNEVGIADIGLML